MKKTKLVSLLALCAGSLIICSYSGGAGLNSYDCTGAETGLGNPVGCAAGCHTLGTTTTVAIELDSMGTPTTHYKGGLMYTVKITGTNTSTTSLPKFGFQLGSIKGSVSSVTPINAGTWTAPYPTGTAYRAPSAGNFVVGLVEQTSSLTATTGTGGAGTTYVKTFNWTAPAAGTGTVSFWGVVNAVNADASNSGDKYNTNHKVINEWPLSIGIAELSSAGNFNFSLFPNPATSQINLTYHLEKQSAVVVSIHDLAGKQLLELKNGTMEAGEQNFTANISNLIKGIYFITLNIDGNTSSKKLIVQ